MLKYRINTRKLNKTKVDLNVENISFVDFENLYQENGEEIPTTTQEDTQTETEEDDVYNGNKVGLIMVNCECSDIDKIKNNSFVSTINTLYLNYGTTEEPNQKEYTFYNDYQVIGANNGTNSFSFYIDKYRTFNVERITTAQDNEDNVYIHFDDFHYFDITDSEIPIHFKFIDTNYEEKYMDGEDEKTRIIKKEVVVDITFSYFSPKVLVAPYDKFEDNDAIIDKLKKKLYKLLFNIDFYSYGNRLEPYNIISEEEYNDLGTDEQDFYEVWNKLIYVNKFEEHERITQLEYDFIKSEDERNGTNNAHKYIIYNNVIDGDVSGVEIYADNFLFGDRTNYEFSFERPLADINVPIVNTFETTLYQMELLNEHFVEAEKKKAINGIVDIEKDVYYPCVFFKKNGVTKLNDVYTIKFNLHFREHRGEDWLVDNGSFWNGIEQVLDGDKLKAQIKKFENDYPLTDDNRSDLLSFLGFTNNDVHYQKNKLKKSFLRLMYFDSMNPGNQNMIGYSTIFFDTGDMFGKYIKYIEKEDYIAVGSDRNEYGKYDPKGFKVGIRVDREPKTFHDNLRLSSQVVVKSKNISKSSSEGFYIYIWKDNEMALPQDLYMKVEFNHAGYGRTIPFMMPYWDKRKWTSKSGIKSLEEILDDWNSVAQNTLVDNKVVWKNGTKITDGHYGIRQYTKFSYIHLKYKYDKDNDRHIYYLDEDTYGSSVTDSDTNEIVINLYEAKVE